jgi:hypothetical protein
MRTITNLNDLHEFFSSLPEGTKASGIASDLEAGNIDEFSVEKPDGTVIEVQYTGPVAEGYVGPFDTQVRVIVYEHRDKSEAIFEIDSAAMEQHERASAEQEIHSRANLESSNPIVGYRFESRDRESIRK